LNTKTIYIAKQNIIFYYTDYRYIFSFNQRKLQINDDEKGYQPACNAELDEMILDE